MRKFSWDEPIYGADDTYFNMTKTWTEKDIEENYLPYYKTQMAKVGKLEEATLENAIKDFCITNWAWEVTSADAP